MGDVLVLLPGTTATILVQPGQVPTLLDPPAWPNKVVTLAGLGRAQQALTLLEGSLYPYQIETTTLLFQPNSYKVFIDSFTADGWTASLTTAPQQSDLPPDNDPAAWGLPVPLPTRSLVTFPYDWRQDNATSASWLRNLLSAIDTASAGHAEITLVGHSMGGLVARAYLETVARTDPWYNRIARLITLGTPHLGAPLALDAITDNFIDLNKAGLPASVDTVAWEFVNSSYDSTYELLPPPQTPFITDDRTLKSFFPISSLSASLQAYLTSKGISMDDAGAAQTFLSSLGYTGAPPYYCAYGSGQTDTPVAFTFNGSTLVEGDGDGDTIVPVSSAMFSGTISPSNTYNAPNVAHGQLPGDSGVIAQVKTWID